MPHLDGDTDWETQAEPYRARIARYLSDTVLPGLEDQIATSLVTTPQDFKDRLLSYNGAGFSLEPTSDAECVVPPAQ